MNLIGLNAVWDYHHLYQFVSSAAANYPRTSSHHPAIALIMQENANKKRRIPPNELWWIHCMARCWVVLTFRWNQAFSFINISCDARKFVIYIGEKASFVWNPWLTDLIARGLTTINVKATSRTAHATYIYLWNKQMGCFSCHIEFQRVCCCF